MAQKYFPGDILEVNMGLYTHVGIVDCKGNVISASRKEGEVVRETLDDFSGDREIKINTTIPRNNTSVKDAIQRAESLIGQKYDVFLANCEHLVRYAYDLRIESPQVQNYTLRAIEIAAITSNNPYVKAMGIGASALHSFTKKDVSPVDNALKGALIALGLCLLFGGNEG